MAQNVWQNIQRNVGTAAGFFGGLRNAAQRRLRESMYSQSPSLADKPAQQAPVYGPPAPTASAAPAPSAKPPVVPASPLRQADGSYGATDPSRPASFDYSQVPVPASPSTVNTARATTEYRFDSPAPAPVNPVGDPNRTYDRTPVSSAPASDGFTSMNPATLKRIAQMKAYAKTGGPQGSPVSAASVPTPASAGAEARNNSLTMANAQSSAMTDLQRLRERAAQLSSQSEEERRLSQDLEQFRGDSAQAIDGLAGQGRGLTVGLVQGQQAKALKQANIQEQTLLARLNAARGSRESDLSATLRELGWAESDIKAAQDAAKANQPIEIGGNLVQLNPQTGRYEVVYQGAGSAASPLSVSPGETIIDPATGQVIYQAPAGASDNPTSVQEYEYARRGGYGGSYADFLASKNQSNLQYVAPSASMGGGTFNPRTGEFVPNSSMPATGTQMPASVLQDIANTQTLLDLISQIPAAGDIPGVGATGWVPGALISGAGREARYTINNILSAIAKLRGGTSFTDSEKKMLEGYTPKPTDTDAEVRSKLQALSQFLNTSISNLQQQFGGSAGGADDPLGFGFSGVPSTTVNGSGDLAAFKNAIARQESGARYEAVGPVTSGGNRAYGKYQVMDFNIPSWTLAALGRSMTPQQFLASPEAQEAVADYKFREYFNKYGNWADVASVWFSGRPVAQAGNASDVTGTTVPRYVQNILSFMG